ncbi:MAG: N-acetylmuramoyl-L-alanine amidase, partial [Alphaproteobacteria bacterium]|nr:N-acetylmuramoyl-L-alanine amidase [Alphaproteobacteria bacterium]
MIKRIILIFILIFIFFNSAYATQTENNGLQPIKKIYLKKNTDNSYYFCIDFSDDASFVPRIHTFPNGVKLILSFKRNIRAPQTKKMKNHKLINGYFFDKIGDKTLMMVLSLKEKVNFSEKRYTNNSIKLKFNTKKKYNIVIDAGHGGKDPGTVCISGDYEKNITLVAAIELRNELLSSGRYNVILTRDQDQFMPIKDRKTRAFGSDFLISLHTDNNSDKNIRGMSIYTLPTLDFIKNKENIISEEEKKKTYYKILSK